MGLRRDSSPILRSFALTSALFMLGFLANSVEANTCRRYGGGFGYGYVNPYPVGGYYPFGAPAYVDPLYWPPGQGAGYSLTDEDRYLGSKRKGDRSMRRNRYSEAAREYRNAYHRATTAWGEESRQAQEAQRLAQVAQEKLERYGDAQAGRDYISAKRKGDRFFARRDFDRAAAQYKDALDRAHTPKQATEASALLVKAQNAKAGFRTSSPAISWRELEAQGDQAVQAGQYEHASEFYAEALILAKRTGNAQSRVAGITVKLTRSQRLAASSRTQGKLSSD